MTTKKSVVYFDYPKGNEANHPRIYTVSSPTDLNRRLNDIFFRAIKRQGTYELFMVIESRYRVTLSSHKFDRVTVNQGGHKNKPFVF